MHLSKTINHIYISIIAQDLKSWDTGKVHIKIFCQNYTAQNIRSLKEEIKTLEQNCIEQSVSNHDDLTLIDYVTENKLNKMDAHTVYFLGLKKKKARQ